MVTPSKPTLVVALAVVGVLVFSLGAQITHDSTFNKITNVASGTADADAAIPASVHLRLCGFAIKESAGTPAAAVVSLVHGATVAGGTQIAGFEYDLAANEEVVEWFGPDCIAVASGVSVDRVSGTTKLTLFHKTVP